MNCQICEGEIKQDEDYAVLSSQQSHVCCLAYHLAFEIDNTMMCCGIAETPAFEKARKSFQIAFLRTAGGLHCQHRSDWKGWPWSSNRKSDQIFTQVVQ